MKWFDRYSTIKLVLLGLTDRSAAARGKRSRRARQVTGSESPCRAAASDRPFTRTRKSEKDIGKDHVRRVARWTTVMGEED